MDEKQYELAADITEERIANAIKKITAKPARESATHCEGCGEAIPEKRRELVPGVELCVNCQALNEMKSRHYR